jgi:hypothetical protein
MSSTQATVSDMLVTVKSREMQRGMLAEMSGQQIRARQHFLAAAHLELVLASDYECAGDAALARRSRISAASCFWRAGEKATARPILESLMESDPDRASEIQEVMDQLSAEVNP